MIKWGFQENGDCYVCGSQGIVVNHEYPNGLKPLCCSCYKTLNPIEEKPEPKCGRKYWGQTEIEIEFTNYMIKNYDRLLHLVIYSYKGPKKSCLLRGAYDDIR